MEAYVGNMVFLSGDAPMNSAGGPTSGTVTSYGSANSSVFGVTLWTANLTLSNMVGLTNNLFYENLNQQRVTLIHEFLHSYLKGASHESIANKLGLSGYNNASDAIDTWISNCYKN